MSQVPNQTQHYGPRVPSPGVRPCPTCGGMISLTWQDQSCPRCRVVSQQPPRRDRPVRLYIISAILILVIFGLCVWTDIEGYHTEFASMRSAPTGEDIQAIKLRHPLAVLFIQPTENSEGRESPGEALKGLMGDPVGER